MISRHKNTRVLFLYSMPRKEQVERIREGRAHDGQLFGLLRLRSRGFDTEFLELEQLLSPRAATWVRRHLLNIHYCHLPFFFHLFRYDIVYAPMSFGLLFLWALVPFSKPKWVIMDFNLIGSFAQRRTVREKVLFWMIGRVNGIVTINEKERTDLIRVYPHLKDRIVFLREGVDTEFFKPRPEIAEEPLVLSVGKHPLRDYATLIEATRGLPVNVVCATKPEFLAGMDVPSNVSVRYFEHDELMKKYAAAQVVVIGLNLKPGSHNDSMGTLAVTEAMAMGKAVVVTHTSSMESYIEHGVTGMLVPQGDAVAMRAAVDELLNDSDKRRHMGEAARAFMVRTSSAEVFADGLADFLKKL